MAVYKPNAADKKVIREGITKIVRKSRYALRVSIVDGPVAADRHCLNALLVSKDGDEALHCGFPRHEPGQPLFPY